MKKALVVGGANGIGLALTQELLQTCDTVYVADRCEPQLDNDRIVYLPVNLINNDLSFLSQCDDINDLYCTAGFGRISLWQEMKAKEVDNQFQVNTVATIKILQHFAPRLMGSEPFHCAIMGSIAGWISSPMFALYSATKAALCRYVESVNIELERGGSPNRILNVSPGSLKGTRFNGGENNLSLVKPLAQEIIARSQRQETLFIPDLEVYGNVLRRYKEDPHKFGVESYDYKLACGRIRSHPQLKIGYLSGTFDLFHIGHLNMLRRAKQYCDYLVVGVHRDASHKGKTCAISLDERMEIVRCCRYVDEVILSEPEDVDVYKKGIVEYDYLFVGSDYKGSERFNRYEAYFADKPTQIIYFPYTQGTSSTALRDFIGAKR